VPERAKFQILLVDDNETNQKVVVLMLKSFGASADIAENGLEALKALSLKDYDFVLWMYKCQ